MKVCGGLGLFFFWRRKESGQVKSQNYSAENKSTNSGTMPSPPKTPESLRKRGCKRRTACGTTAFSKQETKRTVAKEECRVHGRLPIAQRTIVPLGSTSLLSRCRRPRAGIDRLRTTPRTFTSFWWRASSKNCSINCSGIRTGAAACCHCAPDSDVHCQLRSVVQLQTRSQHLDCPLGDVNVHVPELRVQPHSGPSLAAHARESVRLVVLLNAEGRERGHAARCCPRQSREAPHLASVIERGKRNLSRTNVRNKRGFTRNSAAVGDPCNTRLAHGPECDRKWAWSAAHDWASTTVSRNWCSELEDE